MFSTFTTSLIIFMISVVVMLLASILSKKSITDREKILHLNVVSTLNHLPDYPFPYD